MIRIQKDPLQGFGKSVTLLGEELPVPLSAPAESVLAVCCNVKVYKSSAIPQPKDQQLLHEMCKKGRAISNPAIMFLVLSSSRTILQLLHDPVQVERRWFLCGGNFLKDSICAATKAWEQSESSEWTGGGGK